MAGVTPDPDAEPVAATDASNSGESADENDQSSLGDF
jgi:hypothetical protein